jgi:hypothetical protein
LEPLEEILILQYSALQNYWLAFQIPIYSPICVSFDLFTSRQEDVLFLPYMSVLEMDAFSSLLQAADTNPSLQQKRRFHFIFALKERRKKTSREFIVVMVMGYMYGMHNDL